MNGGKDYLELWREEGHTEMPASGHLGQEIGLAVKALPNAFFADGSGNNGVKPALQGFVACGFQVCQCPLTGLLIAVTKFNVRCIVAGVMKK